MLTKPKVGDAVIYIAIAGDEWPARVAKVHDNGEVDLEVISGKDDAMFLRKVQWCEDPIRRSAHPKGAADGAGA
jgi:hypothetical protein